MPEKPRHLGYVELTVRNAVLRRQQRQTGLRCAALASERDRYQRLYLGATGIIAGLQGELAATEAQLTRLEQQAEDAAPTVSGWKVDLDAAQEQNAALRDTVVALENEVRRLRALTARTQPITPVIALQERTAS